MKRKEQKESERKGDLETKQRDRKKLWDSIIWPSDITNGTEEDIK